MALPNLGTALNAASLKKNKKYICILYIFSNKKQNLTIFNHRCLPILIFFYLFIFWCLWSPMFSYNKLYFYLPKCPATMRVEFKLVEPVEPLLYFNFLFAFFYYYAYRNFCVFYLSYSNNESRTCLYNSSERLYLLGNSLFFCF